MSLPNAPDKPRVLIVDDEPPARERLQRLLSELGEYELIGQAENAIVALQLCQQLQPDILLLDVRMPGMTGIEVAQHLNLLNEPPAVIFTTAYEEYAVDAFEAEAIGYLLKPIRKEKLERALQHAVRLSTHRLYQLNRHHSEPTARTHLCVKRGDAVRLIPIQDIRYFVAEQKYITIHHTHGTDLIDESLKDLSVEFADSYIRIHRNSLVAENAINSIERDPEGQYKIHLRDSVDTLFVSRRHRAAVLKRLRGVHEE
jgi:two-component system response regulator AlgR